MRPDHDWYPDKRPDRRSRPAPTEAGGRDDPPAGSSGERQRRDKLATIVGVATVAGVIFGVVTGIVALLPDRDEPVVAYRKQVLATCQRVHSIVTTEHNEILRPDPRPGVTNPEDMIRINKGPLLAVIRGNVSRVRTEFAQLAQQEVPEKLRQQYTAAGQAQEAWLAHYTRVAAAIEQKFRDGDTLRRLNELGLNILERGGQVDTGLNAAMTVLAGEDCRCTR
ncbi:hypothetical protein GCM10009557_29750 [Virgisporangium ochraceum]|uniref:Uncharacterized protein n=2 Tax=Virgisporangium ochraceum TaxID=65505 RepID=A0A8J4EES4_9ACTN|nr:hypothetical protein Voc01_078120 [Virgisporangium ochraceum]